MIRSVFSFIWLAVVMFMIKRSNLYANAFRLVKSGANSATMTRRGAFSGNHLNMADENVCSIVLLLCYPIFSLYFVLIPLHSILNPKVLNKYSRTITEPAKQGASQAMLYATGLNPDTIKQPQIG